ncbi:hypothetical protein [Flavobacterium sp. M31R6]|uniref:hypothetical protein n=1 Tax=Flavobacterium sp. M31R6 TaxID=2739062 RepID=UPI001567FB1B|nr:hypothetical protein [Flavobacterium sp. M31R6]QKJ64962.1 hypothetical protein HQN62_18100 [Flavobacterium sp. M31R6]
METHKNKDLDYFIEEITTCGYFTTLKPDDRKNYLFNAKIGFDRYSSMLIAVQDLLKTCLNTIYNHENGNATEVENPIIHLKTLLEIAVQLLPINEGEAFDAVHKFVLKAKEFEKTDTLSLDK